MLAGAVICCTIILVVAAASIPVIYILHTFLASIPVAKRNAFTHLDHAFIKLGAFHIYVGVGVVNM